MYVKIETERNLRNTYDYEEKTTISLTDKKRSSIKYLNPDNNKCSEREYNDNGGTKIEIKKINKDGIIYNYYEEKA